MMTTGDGTVSPTTGDGTPTTMTVDGTPMTTPGMATPPGGTVPPATTGPDGPAPVDMPGGPTPATEDPVWINARGRVEAARNAFGIQGDWYAFADGVTSNASGNPYRDGKYCVTGEADGMSGNWGVGIGLDLNGSGGQKLPYAFEGKVSGFRIQMSGELPAEARVHFVVDTALDVNPFVPVTLGDQVYSIGDAQVPFSWGVDNAGQRVDGGVLYAIQVLAPGDSAAGPIDLCIEDFEPVYDEADSATGVEGTTYINSDGFVTRASNDYGVEGPFYVISDGASTTQSGVPFRDGKYCVSGTFSGAEADWGAGIAWDLNHPPGMDKAAFDPSSVAGFKVALSGTTPGNVRIQFIVNEPQAGNQPFLVGQMNTEAMYPVAWAQVPTSWEVEDAGLEIASSVYTLQVYLEGTEPGDFDVCIDDIAPLSAADMVYAAEPALAGYSGFRTVDDAVLAAEYATWKRRHFQDCGDGTACVPRDEGDCISEGIGYGMLLTVGNDDQAAFDKLWAYYQKHKNANGVMNWQTDACGGVIGNGSATDGELDAAMALLQAGCKWGGSYEADARALIGAIATSEVARNCSTGTVLKPGDGFGGCSETNPSYVAPGYFKVFGAVTGDAVWTELVDSGYELLAGNQSRKGGVFSDWSSDNGGTSSGNHSDDFGPDASRVPWRLATDYVWSGETRAVPLLQAFADYVEAQGGPARAFTTNSNYRGGSAFSGIHSDAATAQEYTDAWLMTSVDDASYFPGTLRPIYLMLAANRFPKDCN